VPVQPHDPVGTVLAGRYEVLRPLDEESLGRVWAARDHKTGGLVQVKVLLPHLATDPVRFARFGREMTASFLVTHPNTVEVLDYGEEQGVHFLVLEYVAGRTLAQELEKEGRLDPERAALIAAQLATALGAAHQEGIVHRSLAPENVVLLDNAVDGDFVKVRDFGMAKLTQEMPEGADGEGEGEVTATGLRVGDPRYMAPEYIATGQFDGKGDLYALGGLMFHMVAGRPPFQGSRADLLAQNASNAPPRLSPVASNVPRWLDELVDDLLAKAPERRPGVVRIVNRIEDGLGYRSSLPELLPLDSEGHAPPRSAAPAPQRLAWPMVAVIVAVVLCTGTVGILVVGAAIAVVFSTLSLPS
jgi:serine/threonine protein kinase